MIWSAELDLIITSTRGRSSMSQMAEMIGNGCTRNMVAGRISRLGLERLPRRIVCAKARRPRIRRENLDKPRVRYSISEREAIVAAASPLPGLDLTLWEHHVADRHACAVLRSGCVAEEKLLCLPLRR